MLRPPLKSDNLWQILPAEVLPTNIGLNLNSLFLMKLDLLCTPALPGDELSAGGGLHYFTKWKCVRLFLSRSFCSHFCCRNAAERSLNEISIGKGKGKDTLTVLKCNFLVELFIAPSASVASGILSGEMPLKLITSMPLCLLLSLLHGTVFPFFLHLWRELLHINCRVYSFTEIPCWTALSFGNVSRVFSFIYVFSQHRMHTKIPVFFPFSYITWFWLSDIFMVSLPSPTSLVTFNLVNVMLFDPWLASLLAYYN